MFARNVWINGVPSRLSAPAFQNFQLVPSLSRGKRKSLLHVFISHLAPAYVGMDGSLANAIAHSKLNAKHFKSLCTRGSPVLTSAKDAVMIVNFLHVYDISLDLNIRSIAYEEWRRACFRAVQAGRGFLNTVVKLPVLLKKVPGGQSTRSEKTKRHGSPELGLDTSACCRTEQGDTASQCKLGAIVLVLLEKVAFQGSLIPVQVDIE